jgi:hypothetical protein
MEQTKMAASRESEVIGIGKRSPGVKGGRGGSRGGVYGCAFGGVPMSTDMEPAKEWFEVDEENERG